MSVREVFRNVTVCNTPESNEAQASGIMSI